MSVYTQQIDLEFVDYIRSPAETFEDHMRLHLGWGHPGSDVLRDAPQVADIDGVSAHIEAMQCFVAATVVEFEGRAHVNRREVKEFVRTSEDEFGLWGWGVDFIEPVAWRYIIFEGDNYRRLEELKSWL